MHLAKIPILHELIHHALRCENGDPDADEGDRFKAQNQRLWNLDVYKELL